MAYHDGERIAKYLYTDQEWEPETELYNYSARLYDPVLGRFITPDSMVPDPYDPQALNRYVYVKNNPLKYIDPSGHFPMGGSWDSGTDSWYYGWGGGGFWDNSWFGDFSLMDISLYSNVDFYSYNFPQSYRYESGTTGWTDVGNFFLSNPELFYRSGQWHVSYPETYDASMWSWTIFGGYGRRVILPGIGGEIGFFGVFGSEGNNYRANVSAYGEAFVGGGISTGRGLWAGFWSDDISTMASAKQIGIDSPFGSISFLFDIPKNNYGFTIGGRSVGAGSFLKVEPLHVQKSIQIFDIHFLDRK